MRTTIEDRTTSAIIRDQATALFAARGTSGVTVREIAAEAGVSPGSVMHHFGSKDGLKVAVDRRAAVFVEEMLAQMARLGEVGGVASLAALFAESFEREPALAAYVRRLLFDGGEAADELFARLYEASLTGTHALVEAGVVRASQDEAVRVAFLLANDLAVILLRPQLEQVLGCDPLGDAGLPRWTAEAVDVYARGLFEVGSLAPGTSDDPAKRKTER